MNKKLLKVIFTWLCVYPTVTLLIFLLNCLSFDLLLWQRTLVLTMILAPITVLFISPKVGAMIELVTKR